MTTSAVVVTVLVAMLLTIVVAWLVAAEAAFSMLTPGRLDNLADVAEGERQQTRVKRLAGLLATPNSVLAPLRFAILSARLTEATLIAWIAIANLPLGWGLALIGVNILAEFVLAESLPRNIGVAHSESVGLSAARPVALFVANRPMRVLTSALVRLAERIAPRAARRTGVFPEELLAMADAAVEDSVIEPDSRDLIESVIEFRGTVVREVMVPRTDMTTIAAEATVNEALEVTSNAGYSRVPVVGDSIDDVVGLVYVKDLIRAELDGTDEAVVSSLIRQARFVPETKRVSDLLKEMQQHSFHMAMAVDEHGGIAGLVTLEDLIEELVGEIVDEFDVEEPLVERQRDGSLRVDARILIDELNDLAGLELPAGDWDTVGGLVFDTFGRIPSEGESCEADGYPLRVERVQGRRITKVRILHRIEEPAEPLAEQR